VVEILELCPEAAWKERECQWIAYYRKNGCDLTNSTEGGEGYNPSPTTREKMRLAKVGVVPHNKGKKTPDSARAKQSISAKRRWARMKKDERRAYLEKMCKRRKAKPYRAAGWHHTREARQKISDSLKGNTRKLGYHPTPETLQRQSLARRGHIVTDETKRKIGLANGSLIPSQVEHIRGLLEAGNLTGRAIAKLMGTTECVISNIKTGRTYAR